MKLGYKYSFFALLRVRGGVCSPHPLALGLGFCLLTESNLALVISMILEGHFSKAYELIVINKRLIPT